MPTEEQAKAYIAMLTSTASLNEEVAPASIFDFSLAEAAAKGIGAEEIANTASYVCVVSLRTNTDKKLKADLTPFLLFLLGHLAVASWES